MSDPREEEGWSNFPEALKVVLLLGAILDQLKESNKTLDLIARSTSETAGNTW